jgi:DNA-binding winged helix-turn-helix (wHTH) protein/tetratricopeptide (TPR) repeat protein/energy-coupling factor transporter ATP-binding protein EcfA2
LPPPASIVFPPFRLDPVNQSLTRGAETIPLSRKAFAVLRYLLENPGRLVSKNELLDAVWPDTHVSEGVLKVAVAEIRRALHDTSKTPRFLETLHRRGYRFVGELLSPGGPPPLDPRVQPLEREPDLARLDDLLARALEGQRQIVFLTGETGIGKTTLVEAFARRLETSPNVWIAHGHCIEHFGEGEPYFPVLTALAQLCRQPGRESFLPILRLHAPTWLAQMPSLVAEANRDELKREILGAPKERMLREIAEAIEALTAEIPLVLFLEDLHWSDVSTVDLIAHLARGRQPARLLLIGTFRPAEVIVKHHPLRSLKRELQIHHRCTELPLQFLSPAAVARYLALRFPASDFAAGLAPLLYQRTDGNPLFLVNVVDYLLATNQILRTSGGWRLAEPAASVSLGIPDSLRQLIEKQIERLSADERRILTAASVAGLEFSTRTANGGLGDGIPLIESVCQDLSRRGQFLRPAKTIQISDGSLLERYAFTHVLYQHVLYYSLPEPRRAALHKRIGDFQENEYSDHLDEIAAELAVHFEQGRDFPRAIRYLRRSAASAAGRCANREALDYLTHALRLLDHLPPHDRLDAEQQILDDRGTLFRALDDYDGAIATCQRLITLAQNAQRPDWEVAALLKLSAVFFWTDHHRSLEVAARAVERSRSIPSPGLHIQARGYYASRHIRLLGWSDSHFDDVAAAVEAARAAGDTACLGLHLMSYSFFLCYRSQEREACRVASEGMRLGLDTGDAFLYISCLYFQAWALLHLGRLGEALHALHQGLDLAVRNGTTTGEVVLNLVLARLHAHAFDFAAAKDICLKSLPKARPGFPRLIALTMLGEAHLGLGELAEARQCLLQVLRDTESGPYCLDWIFRMPFRHARAELYLARGCTTDAAREALILRDLASSSGQRTYLTLAHTSLARAALAAGNPLQAQRHIADARLALEGAEAPLAEWRLHALAASLAHSRGDSSEALSHRHAAASSLTRLAASLPDPHPLRSNLLDRALRFTHS